MAKRSSSFLHLHAHTKFSANDALSTPEELVEQAARWEQPGAAITDHGNLCGAVKFYKAAKKAGIKPFIGEEFYLVDDVAKKDAKRYHVGLLAVSTTGYQALSRLSTRSHQRDRFHFKPRIDLADLAEVGSEAGDHIVLTTGCFFGLFVQTLIQHGDRRARQILRMYQSWFPHTYVEIQNHGIVHPGNITDGALGQRIFELARAEGMPVIVTQDSHYTYERDKSAHDLLKRMVIRGKDIDEAVFPGDSFHFAETGWIKQHHQDDIWAASERSMAELLEMHRLEIPPLDRYAYHVPEITADPRGFVVDRCVARLRELGRQRDPEYVSRLGDELRVIEQTGMFGYFHVVSEVVDYCDAEGIYQEARGSANGSLVCYLLGITQVDPIKWGIRFDRFLMPDRKKPPDIDLDVMRSRRQDVLRFVASRIDVTQIGTFQELGMNDEGRGSVFVSYAAMVRQSGQGPVPSSFSEVLPEDRAGLRRLADLHPFKGVGVHAAGLVVSGEGQTISDYVPAMLVPASGTMVTQFEGDDLEDLGYLKLDILGQASLDVLHRTLTLLQRDPKDGLAWIPNDDTKTMALLARGEQGSGIFQFEGFAQAKGMRQLRPSKTQDAILAVALFRPAVMNSGMADEFITRRRSRRRATGLHPIFDQHLLGTHGIAVYQEQVLGILRSLGMGYESLNEMLKAVKASNANIHGARETFMRMRQEFSDLCRSHAVPDDQIDSAWDWVKGYAEYSFNLAHATGYGLRGYRSAYLQAHHPLEYMAALLQVWNGDRKEAVYIRRARKLGIPIRRVDVNDSQAFWSVSADGKSLRRGLLSVHGIGLATAASIEENQPFSDLSDLVARTNARAVTGGKDWARHGTLNGKLAILRDAGALRSLGVE